MGSDESHPAETAVNPPSRFIGMVDLQRANLLMIEALAILDAHRHGAAPHLDLAIVHLGLRPDGEGMPPE